MSATKRLGRLSWHGLFLAIIAIGFVAGLVTPCSADLQPKKLLIYYGWPSIINGTFSANGAAAEFSRYDYLVLGDGLEKATHPDHNNTVAILGNPFLANTRGFGYIDLGVSTQNLPLTEIFRRVDEWTATGASGIFFDDFGYDFQTDRIRQDIAVGYAHFRGRAVIANAFRPEDAFGEAIDPLNPYGLPSLMGKSDFYLYESHQIQLGAFVDEATWQSKANKVKIFQDALGFRVFSITTSDVSSVYDEGEFFYAWYSALMYGHEATGWGELYFSAASGSAPFRSRPVVSPGSIYTGPVVNSSPRFTRNTNLGTVFVNTASHDAGFVSH